MLKSQASPQSPGLFFVLRQPLPCLSPLILTILSLLPLKRGYWLHANMPIIGSTVVGTVSVGTCIVRVPTAQSVVSPTPGAAEIVKRELAWSHSEVYVTSYGTSTALKNLNVPDLTTIHTPDPSCIDRWVFLPTSNCGDDNGTDDVVWSVRPDRLAVPDPSYNGCQLYGSPTYSPGVCPSGQTIAEVTAFESSASNGNRTFWQASCCRR